jgi:hypothetical protein
MVTVAGRRASVSGVVDHDAPICAGTSGENWSIGDRWSRREVQSRSNCLGCSS